MTESTKTFSPTLKTQQTLLMVAALVHSLDIDAYLRSVTVAEQIENQDLADRTRPNLAALKRLALTIKEVQVASAELKIATEETRKREEALKKPGRLTPAMPPVIPFEEAP